LNQAHSKYLILPANYVIWTRVAGVQQGYES